jgi:phosphomannomutase
VSHWFVSIPAVGTLIYAFVVKWEYAGFKFIGNTALTLIEQGFEVPFAYEEAIGFMIGAEIRDKDGVAAAVHTRSR